MSDPRPYTASEARADFLACIKAQVLARSAPGAGERAHD